VRGDGRKAGRSGGNFRGEGLGRDDSDSREKGDDLAQNHPSVREGRNQRKRRNPGKKRPATSDGKRGGGASLGETGTMTHTRTTNYKREGGARERGSCNLGAGAKPFLAVRKRMPSLLVRSSEAGSAGKEKMLTGGFSKSK